MYNFLRTIYAKILIRFGKAIDIWSGNPYPSYALSNLCHNEFDFEGVHCGSMEGLLQAIKWRDEKVQLAKCAMEGRRAKKRSTSEWQAHQLIYWKGKSMQRQSPEYWTFLQKAYEAMFQQCERFRKALLLTKGKKLYHLKGVKNPTKTILTEKEFCTLLTELRDKHLASNLYE